MDIITPNDILQIRKGKWYHNGRELTDGEIRNLKSEAELIARTSLWKLLVSEGKYHAQRQAIMDSDTGDDGKDVKILRNAQTYHKVVVMFETFIRTIVK